MTSKMLISILALSITLLACQAWGDVILSEVFYDAVGSDNGLEWVELYNNGSASVDLSSYSLGNGGTNYTTSTVQLSGTIAAGGFFILGGPTSSALNFNPTFDQQVNFSPDFQNATGTTADGVALFNVPTITSSTVPIDAVIYGTNNDNDLLDETGNPGAVDVGDAPAGSSLQRTNLSTWAINSNPNPGNSLFEASLPVFLSRFTAHRSGEKVVLQWVTETEIDHLGWNIYRAEKPIGEFVKINEKLIPGAGNSATPRNYEFIDKTAAFKHQYYYYLEDIDVSGQQNRSQVITISDKLVPSKTQMLPITWGNMKKTRGQ